MLRIPCARVLWLTLLLLLSAFAAGCKPVTAPGTAFTAPQGTFALILPPGFAALPAAEGGPMAGAGTALSFTGFTNANTGERIAVGFITLTGNQEADAMMLAMWLMALPVGSEWQSVTLVAAGAPLTDERYTSTRTLDGATVRLDVRDKESGAALSMVFQQHDQTLAALAVSNPNEPAHVGPGAALLDTLLPTFVWPAPAVTPTPAN